MSIMYVFAFIPPGKCKMHKSHLVVHDCSLELGLWDCVSTTGAKIKNCSLERGSWDCVSNTGTETKKEFQNPAFGEFRYLYFNLCAW